MEIILDSRFDDLEQLSSLTKAWDLDFRLIQKGGFQGQIRQSVMPEILISYARFNSRLHQAGTTPPGYRTYGLPDRRCQGFWWLGHEVDGHCVMRFGTDSELMCVSSDDFAVYTLSLREDFLEQLSESLGLSFPGPDRKVTRIARKQIATLRQLAKSAVFHRASSVRAEAANQLAQRLLACCADGTSVRLSSAHSRDRAIKRIIEYLTENRCNHPNLSDLCEVAHVSERTLQYAFRERYGLSPVQFVRCWHLNSARQLLLSSSRNGRTIGDIAGMCGFYDPSVFARHYRLLHGELPSATIARADS
jgi:AraC family ethanolamine operon transcriptional activator